jgi:hypothetical protein
MKQQDSLPSQWISKISLNLNQNQYLKYWDQTIHDTGTVVQIHRERTYEIDGISLASSLIYSQGAEEHQDTQLATPYSSLLILYNKGFLVWQEGLPGMPQKPGMIISLNIHKTHELAQVDERCKKWAAIAVDYHQPLEHDFIETQLKDVYDRIFAK